MKIEIPIYDGFDDLDAIGPYELLATAGRYGAPFDVALVHLHGAERVVTGNGTVIVPARPLSDAVDLVIVPGGGWRSGEPIGVRGEIERGDLPAAVARLHAGGARVASVCTGAMILAAAGLLDGRPATTHHSALRSTTCGRRAPRSSMHGSSTTATC